MDKFGFVILHYLAPDTTRRCINSLLERFRGISVVVVDNASPDGSGALLEKEYAGRDEVTVIRNAANLGFAAGNNVGYKFLKQSGECKFIVVMNNDVIIEDPLFPEKVRKVYDAAHFAVLGPDILNPVTGVHQNPAHLKAFTSKELEELRDKYAGYLQHFYWKRLKWNIKKLFSPSSGASPASSPCLEAMQDVVLHGACYIFSELFTSVRELCFNPSTFMYFEEDILHFECARDGLKTVYDPSVQVLHLEDVSTRAAFKSNCRKDRFKFGEMLKSIEVLMALMK